MITKTVIISIACCALIAPLAFGQGSQYGSYRKGSHSDGNEPGHNG